jgi:lipoprotein-anchoring transpeptidase ErfK/SrfK
MAALSALAALLAASPATASQQPGAARLAFVRGASMLAQQARQAEGEEDVEEPEEAQREIASPSRARGATIAGVAIGAEARARPGAGRRIWRVGTSTGWSGEPQVLLVLGSATKGEQQWLRVLLPVRPDGTSGWIPRQNVVLMTTPYWVIVNKGARTVSVYRNGRLLHSSRSVIGKPATPTPDGLAAIYEVDQQPDPTGFLGPWAMPLTALSGVLRNFGGGPGRVAIHGRGGESLLDPLGSAASHGCVRIDNGPITWMAHHLPQGTPVQIVD